MAPTRGPLVCVLTQLFHALEGVNRLYMLFWVTWRRSAAEAGFHLLVFPLRRDRATYLLPSESYEDPSQTLEL